MNVEYFNENFEKVTETLDGHKAIVVQHEFDHLQGIVFTDKISPLRRKMLQKRLNNIAKGKVGVSYKVKIA